MLATSVKTVYALVVVTAINAAGEQEVLSGTAEHPYWVGGRGWTEASDLAVGDVLFDEDGVGLAVSGLASSEHPDGIEVFNLEVEGDHTCLVEDGSGTQRFVWVHNNAGCDQPIWSKQMLSSAEQIAKGGKIRKVDTLVAMFGGQRKNWRKMEAWDHDGQEWHYYECNGFGRVGVRRAGEPDPLWALMMHAELKDGVRCPALSPSRHYLVLGIQGDYLRLRNNRGDPVLYPQDLFFSMAGESRPHGSSQ